jgi:hypothetical protein
MAFSKSTIKSILKKVRYDLNIYKKIVFKENIEGTGRIRDIFSFFRTHWISQFVIGNEKFGGKNDYTTFRISMLNLPETLENVNFKDKRVLELGPLEGGNTIKLEQLGAKEIVSVEGRVENFVKSCVIKNIYKLNRTTYYYDDARNISSEKYGRFDIAVVLGLLYHLEDPQILLIKLGEIADTLVLATHYADVVSPYPNAKEIAITSGSNVYKGRIYTEDPGFDPNAGLQNYSVWPYESDLITMCKDSGFLNVKVIARNPDPNEQYKLIYIVATK